MIYRFVVADLAITSGTLLLCTSFLARRIVQIVLNLPKQDFVFHRVLGALLRNGWLWVLVVAFLATAAALVAPSFVELVRTGATYEHWSRFIAASVLVSVSIILIVTRVLDYTIDLLEARMAFVREHEGDLSLRAVDVA